ncbi:MAG: hypothetical protein PHT44_03235 [Candidatus Portnoybacteria bacterium]|nr:hypothetical protein [Candidatus Portnoybacteria bacterium]MDD4982554.1 hypothetical protein [Candidatus Portnoybacteria bacterium]
MNKKIIWAVVILVMLAAFLGGFYFYKAWWPTKQLKIQAGLSSDKFPWRDYSQEELNKLYPQIRYADVPTRITPEQTYAKFREALRTNNLEVALEQLAKDGEKYNENKLSIEKAYKEEKFVSLSELYLDKLNKSYMYESIAQYYFADKENNKNTNYPINFIKDANGDWKMDSL